MGRRPTGLPLEKDFQREVLKRLRTLPDAWWIKLNDKTTVGLPDIIGCAAGTMFALELKTISTVTPIQAYTLRKIAGAGGQSFVLTPENWEAVFTYIRNQMDVYYVDGSYKRHAINLEAPNEVRKVRKGQKADNEAACSPSSKPRRAPQG